MSQKYSYTTSDYIPWKTMTNLVRKLGKDGDYRMSLLIGCGSFFGLRISDLKQLTWNMLLEGELFELREKKTNKRRRIKINERFQKYANECYHAMHLTNRNEHVFISRKGSVMTTQHINRQLKKIKEKYKVPVEHFSTHSLRKTFGRKVVEDAGDKSEMALIKLSEIFNHSSIALTRRYLGLRQQEMEDIYDNMEF